LALAFWLTHSEQRRRLTAERELHRSAESLTTAAGESQRLARELRALSDLAELLQSCRSVEEACEGIRNSFAKLLPSAGGRLALINPSQNLVAIGAHWGHHTLLAESVFSPEDCWALRRGQIHPPLERADGFSCRHMHFPNVEDVSARYVCIPLSAQGEMLGVLTLDSNGDLPEAERQLALAATDHLALAIANLRLQQDLRTQSIRDPLTGLFNRRYLEASIERELARAARRNQRLALMMLDLDHFKRINDTFGHDAGDQILARFGQLLGAACRGEDIACRFGGEEFTAILVDCEPEMAQRRAEELRQATAALEIVLRGQRLGPITVSIGIATFPAHGATPQTLITAADQALYAAKRDGRDRVMLAPG
jgi:diguanylate cyclase (GGDEF)-like protein